MIPIPLIEEIIGLLKLTQKMGVSMSAGSLADIKARIRDVRFTLKSADKESLQTKRQTNHAARGNIGDH
jgi:hypothetical protein